VKGIQNCSNKGPVYLPRGDNHKNGVGSFVHIIVPQSQVGPLGRENHIYMHVFILNRKMVFVKYNC
jgi:hypothetical protein